MEGWAGRVAQPIGTLPFNWKGLVAANVSLVALSLSKELDPYHEPYCFRMILLVALPVTVGKKNRSYKTIPKSHEV